MILDDMVLEILAGLLELIAFFAPVVLLHQVLVELILVVEVRFIVTSEADVMCRRVLAVLGQAFLGWKDTHPSFAPLMFRSIAAVTQDGHEAIEVSVADGAEESVVGAFDPGAAEGVHRDWV